MKIDLQTGGKLGLHIRLQKFNFEIGFWPLQKNLLELIVLKRQWDQFEIFSLDIKGFGLYLWIS